MELTGKRAIVTGSTRGIGLAVAETLVGEGAHVVVSARGGEDVEQTVQGLNALGGGRAVGKTCDVREPDQVRDLIDFCVGELGGLDVLVNNAGIGRFSTVEEMSLQDWRDTIATNLDSLYYGCHFAIPPMKKSGAGFIVNIGSLAGKNAFPKGAAYNASKFGLAGFSEALMQEIRHDGIRVAYVMPGSVDTGWGGRAGEGAGSWKLSPQDVADVVIDTLKRDPRCLTSRIEMRPSRPPRN